ncbi:MAG: hypothetical protein M3R50_04100 [Bacteroidota bacterium]|nr:hypothetical protein [Bacteroidota bacterium]
MNEKVDGPIAGIGFGYIPQSGSIQFNIGIRYEHDRRANENVKGTRIYILLNSYLKVFVKKETYNKICI